LYLLIGMTNFSSKWIFSHSAWYKKRRSRQLGTSEAVSRAEHGAVFDMGTQFSQLYGQTEARTFLR
jgi:hypothetical protein